MQTSAFSNAGGGTVIKTAGAGQTTINVPFQQVGGALDLNSRTISFQGGISQTNADSVTYLDNGTLIVAGTFTVTAGQVLGFGTIQGGLKLDGGTLDLTQETTTGTVSVTGNYEQTAASTIMLKVGDTGGAVNTPVNDQISVTGTATIAGGLTVRLLTGKRPRANDSFKLISATGGLTGTFDPAKVNLQVPGTGLVWDDIAYGTKDVTLTAIAAP